MSTGSTGQLFGGDWTEQKLAILEAYLDSYTTALKNSRFELVYIDAFAGSGKIELRNQSGEEESLFEVNDDFERFIDGSAIRAINVVDKPFDGLVFIDTNTEYIDELEKLKRRNPDRRIRLRNDDANTYLSNLMIDKSKWRGVLFLDPYGAQVSWSTIERVANLQALDAWILFPTLAISRTLPTSRIPDEINVGRVDLLNRVYGGEYWRELYESSESDELSGLDDAATIREKGTEKLSAIYRTRLRTLFRDRFLDETKELKHPKGATLYELMFCVGSPDSRAIGAAKRIAKFLIERI